MIINDMIINDEGFELIGPIVDILDLAISCNRLQPIEDLVRSWYNTDVLKIH